MIVSGIVVDRFNLEVEVDFAGVEGALGCALGAGQSHKYKQDGSDFDDFFRMLVALNSV